MKSLLCATLDGFEAQQVVVEVSITSGLPSFSIVGLVSTAISEAKERVKSALAHSNFRFPPKKITLNLSPSELQKSGSHFDLPIALLIALENTTHSLDGWYVFGELGLDGSIKESRYIYPLILSLAKQNKLSKVIVPKEALTKLSKIPQVELYGFATLQEVLEAFQNNTFTPSVKQTKEEYPFIDVGQKKYYYTQEYTKDFLDIKGQAIAKRAALIAATGWHNLLLEGSPGCGKSMIAQRLFEILPPLSQEEILEIAKIKILSAKEADFLPKRPFIAPHHSATKAAIFGGGSKNAQVGEVALAHLGELFFDELPHFSKSILEALREPLQDKKIRISRVHSKIEYQSDFLFVAALNPCPCGNLLDETKECRCSDVEIQRYKNKLSDPFLDRIDLFVVMQKVSSADQASVSSKELHQQVLEGFMFQKQRGQQNFNANLSEAEIETFCLLDEDAQAVLDMAIKRYALSFRSINSIKKVARTIADLAKEHTISKTHILEALSFRRRG